MLSTVFQLVERLIKNTKNSRQTNERINQPNRPQLPYLWSHILNFKRQIKSATIALSFNSPLWYPFSCWQLLHFWYLNLKFQISQQRDKTQCSILTFWYTPIRNEAQCRTQRSGYMRSCKQYQSISSVPVPWSQFRVNPHLSKITMVPC